MKLSDFSRFVIPEVIGCSDPLMEQALIQVAYEFCDKSGAWDELQEPQPLISGVPDYEIDVPQGAIALRVVHASIDGRMLHPEPLANVQHLSATQSDPRFFNSAIERGAVRLFPTPGRSGQKLELMVAFAPSMTANSLPDFLMQRHADAIASGTKARLMLVPGQSWSNPQLGAYYSDRFQQGIVDARIERLHGRVSGSLQVQARKFR